MVRCDKAGICSKSSKQEQVTSGIILESNMIMNNGVEEQTDLRGTEGSRLSGQMKNMGRVLARGQK